MLIYLKRKEEEKDM